MAEQVDIDLADRDEMGEGGDGTGEEDDNWDNYKITGKTFQYKIGNYFS